MLSAQPQLMMRSAPRINSTASGEAKPPEIPSDHGLPSNKPLATALVASKAPADSASRSSSARARRAAAGDEDRSLGYRQRLDEAGDAVLVDRDVGVVGRVRTRHRPSRNVRRLHVERQVEQHGAPVVARRPISRGRFGHG